MSQKRNPVAFDVECYSNYFLVLFKGIDGRVLKVSLHNDIITGDMKAVKAIYRINPLVTFNGDNYDIPMLCAFMDGWSNAELKKLSDAIIVKNLSRWQLTDYFPKLRVRQPQAGHIDLTGATPLQASLKAYGCRIHSPKLQDLPIDPSATITCGQVDVLERYCENDVDVTWDIYDTLKPQLKLRGQMTKEYGVDMRSKSDAQIAEAIIKQRMQEAGHSVDKRDTPVKPFKYEVPDFILFKDPTLCTVLDAVRSCEFSIKDTGNVILPDAISKVIEFDGAKYKLGIGGLHSQEKRQVVEPTTDEVLGEYDVASYYPSIILGQNLYPKHLGEEFVGIYRNIFEERLAAKRSGNKTTADTLKIVLNSSYGKFGSKYSFLYSPELLVQTTLSGQLALLMLIERVTNAGAKVVSANTDGINVLMPKSLKQHIDAICSDWTAQTTYQLEWVPYQATYSESVNSYIAIKPNGDVKTKGLYESGSISKGYSAQICNDAVIAYLKDGVPIEETVGICNDVRQFLIMRGVRGGATWRNQELGKVVRWYQSVVGEPIRYKTNGNKVAGSDKASPMMDLIGYIPDDIDYTWYVDTSYDKLKRLGYEL